jgi:glycosidase
MADTVLYQIFPDRFARSDPSRPAPEWAIPAAWNDPLDPSTRDAATSSTAETSTASWTGWTTSSIWV